MDNEYYNEFEEDEFDETFDLDEDEGEPEVYEDENKQDTSDLDSETFIKLADDCLNKGDLIFKYDKSVPDILVIFLSSIESVNSFPASVTNKIIEMGYARPIKGADTSKTIVPTAKLEESKEGYVSPSIDYIAKAFGGAVLNVLMIAHARKNGTSVKSTIASLTYKQYLEAYSALLSETKNRGNNSNTGGTPDSDEDFIKSELGSKSTTGNEFVDDAIRQIVDRIIDVSTACQEVKPTGVIYKGGLICYDKGKRVIYQYDNKGDNEAFLNMYNRVNGFLRGSQGGNPYNEFIGLLSGNTVNYDAYRSLIFSRSLNYNYLPEFCIYIAYLILPRKDGSYHHFRNTSTFKRGITSFLFDLVSEEDMNKSGLSGTQVCDNLWKLFVNTFVLTKYNKAEADFIMYNYGCSVFAEFGEGLKENPRGIFGSPVSVLYSGQSKTGVYNLVVCRNRQAYTSEVLFAYKAYAELTALGKKPDVSNLVLGRQLNGRNLTWNLNKSNEFITTIVAGSGSGKGVLTLNMLVTLIANGCPFVYLDCKPDMSATMWDLERKYTAQGYPCRILAIDGTGNPAVSGSAPIRSYPLESTLDPELGVPASDYVIVPYLKALQLFNVMMKAKANAVSFAKANGTEVDPVLTSDNRSFLIIDEMRMAYDGTNTLVEALGRVDLRKASQELKDKIKKYKSFLTNQSALGISKFVKESARIGNGGYIDITQKGTPSEFGLGSWASNPFGSILNLTDVKIVGKGGEGTKDYSLPKNVEGYDLITDKTTSGYFAVHSGIRTPEKSNVTVMKSYLLLNVNDYTGKRDADGYLVNSVSPLTTGLINRVCNHNRSKEDALIETDIAPNGIVREEIGFEGLIKKVMLQISSSSSEADIAKALSKGYDAMWRVMEQLGLSNKYKDIEQYLYDVSPSAIYTYEEMVYCLSTGSKLIEGGTSNSDSYDGFASEDGSESFDNNPEDWGNTEPQGDSHPPYTPPTPAPQPHSDTSPDSFDSPVPLHTSEPIQQSQLGNNTNDPYEQYNVDDTVYKDVFRVQESENPFNRAFRSRSMLGDIASMRLVSKTVLENIKYMVGDLSRVHSFQVEESGKLVINGILFQPELSETYTSVLPFDIQRDVKRGCWAELFNFSDLYQFKNLGELSIDSVDFAENKVRNDLGLGRKGWTSLSRKLHSLRVIRIGGTPITDKESEKDYEGRKKRGYGFTETVKKGFGMASSAFTSSHARRVWDSKPARVTKKALGYTLGVKAVLVGASIFGGWALLAGAFATAAIISDKRKGK